MSVILDALRRSRKGATRSGSATDPGARPHVPAGLGLGAFSAPVSGSRPARPRLLGIGLLLVIGLGAWAAIRVSQSLLTNYAAPAQSSRSSPARNTPPAPTPATPNQAPNQASDQTPQPQSSPPTVVLRSAPGAEKRAPGPEANQFDLAVRYYNLGDYDAALKHYRAVLAADRFNVEAHNNLGLLYHRRGSPKEAIEQFRLAIAINAEYVKARNNLAVVLMEAGRLAEARAELRAAMAVEPRSADLIVNLALVENADRHREEAIELLVRAIGYEPTHAMAHYNVAVLYDEKNAFALAYDHYTLFLKYASPEQGELLSAVQQRLLILTPNLARAR
jgi:tetratricopeptide (TPR) repeat protein